MEILIKNKAVETFLEEIAATIRDCYPEDYDRFLKHVELEGQNLVRPSGISEDGHFMNFMKIPMVNTQHNGPQDLYSAIKVLARKRLGIDDFFRDRTNYDLLCKVWKDAKVKKHKPVILDLGALNS